MEKDILNKYLKELRGGSYEAFNIIYDLYVDKLYAFVLAHTKSKSISEDIVQDVFLQVK